MCVDVDFDCHATAVDLGIASEWDPYVDSSSSLVAVGVGKERVYCDRGTQTEGCAAEVMVARKNRAVCDRGTQTDEDGEGGVLAAKVFSSVGILLSAVVVFAGVWRVLGRK